MRKIVLIFCTILTAGNLWSMHANKNGIHYELTDSIAIVNRYYNNSKKRVNVNIPDHINFMGKSYSVTIIGEHAFDSCYWLNGIHLPKTIREIRPMSFADCHNLVYINIPDSVSVIGTAAFSYCHQLSSINIPKSVKRIDPYAFSNCENLSAINVDVSNSTFDSRNGCNAIIRTIDNCLMIGCSNTFIPESVVKIGSYAFSGSSIQKITFPQSLETIESGAFIACQQLDTIICLPLVPPSVEHPIFTDMDSFVLIVPKESMMEYSSHEFWSFTYKYQYLCTTVHPGTPNHQLKEYTINKQPIIIQSNK